MRVLPKILAIDDDQSWLDQVPLILEDDATVTLARSIDEGLELVQREFFDLVLLDLNFERDSRSGIEVFKVIKALDRGLDVIVVSGETNPLRLIEVFNFGVTRFIPKPATTDMIRGEIRKSLDERSTRLDVLKMEKSGGTQLDPFVGTSPAIRALREKVLSLIGAPHSDILIQGETGAGKEVISRFIASRTDPSARLLPIHCGAIADGIAESELFGHVKGAFTGADRDRVGVFEAAAGGFVFLDEIGEMSLSHQTKLLRVLQERKVQRVGSHEERKVNFRTICATHVDLETAVKERRFREDLYYRISKSVLRLPSLRNRREDIGPILASMKLRNRAGEAVTFSEGAISVLMLHDWPGNIRQLKAVAENIAFRTSGTMIREADVYSEMPDLVVVPAAGLTRGPMGTYGFSLLNAEKKRFQDALNRAGGSRDGAAKLLGLSRATYFRRAKELGIVRVK